MDPFNSIGDAIAAIVQFDRAKFGSLPEHTQAELDRLAGVGISPVDRIVRTAEALFAERAALTRKQDRELVAGLMDFAALNGWHGLNDDNRAGRVASIMRAANGDGRELADADVPEPRPEFLAPPAEPAS